MDITVTDANTNTLVSQKNITNWTKTVNDINSLEYEIIMNFIRFENKINVKIISKCLDDIELSLDEIITLADVTDNNVIKKMLFDKCFKPNFITDINLDGINDESVENMTMKQIKMLSSKINECNRYDVLLKLNNKSIHKFFTLLRYPMSHFSLGYINSKNSSNTTLSKEIEKYYKLLSKKDCDIDQFYENLFLYLCAYLCAICPSTKSNQLNKLNKLDESIQSDKSIQLDESIQSDKSNQSDELNELGELIRIMLSEKNIDDECKHHAVIIAVKNNNMNLLLKLLSEDVLMLDEDEDYYNKKNILNIACEYGSFDIVKFLFSIDDFDPFEFDGNLPSFIKAYNKSHYDICEYLLKDSRMNPSFRQNNLFNSINHVNKPIMNMILNHPKFEPSFSKNIVLNFLLNSHEICENELIKVLTHPKFIWNLYTKIDIDKMKFVHIENLRIVLTYINLSIHTNNTPLRGINPPTQSVALSPSGFTNDIN